ncbi:hypothetical protein H4F99_03730 [Lysobacter sp. SG-8]|uniref:Uncharacterized protein n=1 Tax=Marilutibacter penaei TaxID=2759900 RepID=A0A7W3U2V0_9GAMM|nr:hypothetical protein [Lysobacter penaei]MBB1087595.1 hypothetical protein [Lysobacter penaei]
MPAQRFARWISALPDAITAAFFLSLWVAPTLWGPTALRTALLMMLVEFVLLHASAMLGSMVLSNGDGTRRKGWHALLGFGLLYLVFIAAWAWQFRAWWPLLAFGWLLLGKLWLVFQPAPDMRQRQRMQSEWAIGVMAYLAGTFATVLLPVPRLGLEASIVAQAELPGSGLWVSKPHTVVAFGAFYFAVLAITRARGTVLKHAGTPSRG